MVAIFEIKKMPLKILTSIITCIGRITNWRHNKKALGLWNEKLNIWNERGDNEVYKRERDIIN